ncbi:glycosyltransferase family 4 protein [Bradyrhizobium canariense]|uniref:Glycosyltransferase WbuB n=1 Tax=Bradyrhizobium canariense TaxID=255045 RepID=A0A1X3H4K7_9BRAD|nr:glycosyltransferase family 4 protein [Bradyrhizobium canariense]OSI69442.1 glycosyltransferase WbuB [Bradyrhizobium canariense]OSI78298.1 glycosyltransferase WbuB [Bradyrhizobium canariense]OSI90198.1 glycosyltransferase WbuB [Bradyrhizobium canariense]OSI93547.1 glycosyltransferase WbuB [Bradyrhizobium canariense]OSJ03524.1 glycosyltransferase WbuB [Bradyrhizobium canariense]
MQIALISTDYPPLRTSAAVQLRDLAQQIAGLGHHPVVIVPSPMSGKPWMLERMDGIEVLRLAAPPTRSPSFARRAIAEMWLPFAMLRSMRRSPFASAKWDLLVWYSPPVFFGPLVAVLRRKCRAKTYLILRDIFPEWALDLGLINRGPVFFLFKAVAAIQYAIADVIGVQTPSNLAYLSSWASPSRRIEVLHNWLRITPDIGCSIALEKTALAGRKIFVYIGNMGVAQGLDIFLELIERSLDRTDIGFVFVGRGSEFARLQQEKASRGLKNTLFFDEIDSCEIPGLLAQCHVGLVALHPDHKTHNIPGKFVSYVQYGVPVLARVNAGTDLQRLIEDEQVGKVYVGDSVSELKRLAVELVDDAGQLRAMAERGRKLGRSMFSPIAAARQIVASAEAASATPGE